MPPNKKSHSEDELLPAPDVEAFKELLQLSGFSSIYALSAAVTSAGDGNLIGRAIARERRLKLVEAIKIARALNVPLTELLKIFGYEMPDIKVPIRARINADGTLFMRENPTTFAPAPTQDSGRLECAILYSADTPLSAWDQFGFYFEPYDRPAANAYDRIAIVKPANSKRPYLGVMPRSTGRYASLIPFGASEELKVKEIEWSTPVLWIKCTG